MYIQYIYSIHVYTVYIEHGNTLHNTHVYRHAPQPWRSRQAQKRLLINMK